MGYIFLNPVFLVLGVLTFAPFLEARRREKLLDSTIEEAEIARYVAEHGTCATEGCGGCPWRGSLTCDLDAPRMKSRARRWLADRGLA